MDQDKKQIETLEMRVAELEDKLAQIDITEEEMRAYHKVSNLLRGQPAEAGEPPGVYMPGPRHCGLECVLYGQVPGGGWRVFRGLGY